MNRGCEDPPEGGLLEGRYANYFTVGYNAFEFLLDFGQFYPEGKEARLHTRIITNPIYAKTLLELLRESIDRYEQTFGHIAEGSEEGPKL
ncbi:MAG: DUF3467 domain-containing protein [Candidatus Methylomirabilis sp.]|nr:DUF3467 domain-containing protein [Candidatus Methylomirabilis sp.]